MIVRQAFFRGRVVPGRDAEFRRFVEDRMLEGWKRFPGARDVRVLFELDRDEGADPIPLSLAMSFDDSAALDRMMASPERAESRALTGELMQLFEGRIEHHVFEML